MNRNRPALYSFGRRQVFLADDVAGDATTAERIQSVWAYLTQKVLVFERTLKPRERINYDAEDVVQTLYIKLSEQDHKFDATRSKYVNFAAAVIDRELCNIRDRSRTIASPKNSSCRVKKYAAKEEAGELSERCRKTSIDIARTTESGFGIDHLRRDTEEESDPSEIAGNTEIAVLSNDAINSAMARLAPKESYVVSHLCGLWGCTTMTEAQIAWKLRRHRDEVAHIRDKAIAKIKRYLIAIDHPALTQFA